MYNDYLTFWCVARVIKAVVSLNFNCVIIKYISNTHTEFERSFTSWIYLSICYTANVWREQIKLHWTSVIRIEVFCLVRWHLKDPSLLLAPSFNLYIQYCSNKRCQTIVTCLLSCLLKQEDPPLAIEDKPLLRPPLPSQHCKTSWKLLKPKSHRKSYELRLLSSGSLHWSACFCHARVLRLVPVLLACKGTQKYRYVCCLISDMKYESSYLTVATNH